MARSKKPNDAKKTNPPAGGKSASAPEPRPAKVEAKKSEAKNPDDKPAKLVETKKAASIPAPKTAPMPPRADAKKKPAPEPEPEEEEIEDEFDDDEVVEEELEDEEDEEESRDDADDHHDHSGHSHAPAKKPAHASHGAQATHAGGHGHHGSSKSTTASKGGRAKVPHGAETITLRVKRQAGPDETPYWEEFVVQDLGDMNVITCLMAIQKNPVTSSGKATTPVSWDQACLEEVCGSCTMVINGRVRQSCSALIRNLQQPVTIEPMQKFPVVRDLCVDRSRMFEALKRVKAWVAIDGTHDLGPGPKISPEEQEVNYKYSECMTCGCCVDACPQVNEHSDFIGAAAIGQARLFNAHPVGKFTAGERIEALMEDGGLHECGNAQNCVQVCPKGIPLTTAIAEMGQQTSLHLLKKLLKG